jgi:hypothetical protein
MKIAISTVVLLLLTSIPALAAQEPDKEKEKPAHQEEPKKQEPPKEHQQPQNQEKPRQQPQDREQDKARATQDQQKEADRAKQTDKQRRDSEKQQQQEGRQQQQSEKDRAKQERVTQEHSQQAQHDERNQAQRDGGNHSARRIREEDFHTHFGRQHTFRVARRDDRRFNYGGYWFVYSQPWPYDWNYDDDVYVDEVDGEYYLIDPVHPGPRLLIVVAD